jgi:hypothetical protein
MIESKNHKLNIYFVLVLNVVCFIAAWMAQIFFVDMGFVFGTNFKSNIAEIVWLAGIVVSFAFSIIWMSRFKEVSNSAIKWLGSFLTAVIAALDIMAILSHGAVLILAMLFKIVP